MAIRVRCPDCDAVTTIEEELAGERVFCGSCGRSLRARDKRDDRYGRSRQIDKRPSPSDGFPLLFLTLAGVGVLIVIGIVIVVVLVYKREGQNDPPPIDLPFERPPIKRPFDPPIDPPFDPREDRPVEKRIEDYKLPPPEPGNLLVNGDFEQGPIPHAIGSVQVNQGSDAIPGWRITGSVDIVGTQWQTVEGKYSLDLNGADRGAIAQTFKTKLGQKYKVSFLLAGSPYWRNGGDMRFTVSTAGQSAEFSIPRSPGLKNMNWQVRTWRFVANAESTTLEFASLVDGDTAAALDRISVVEDR